MAKQVKELRKFITGTQSAPSATDVPDEAPVYSKNIESLDEEGKLKGIRKNVAVTYGSDPTKYIYFIGNDPYEDQAAVYSYKILDTEGSYTAPGVTGITEWQSRAHRTSFRSQLAQSKYIESVELKSMRYDSGQQSYVEGDFYNSGFTLPGDIGSASNTITFTDAISNYSPVFFSGQKIKINNEILVITGLETPEGNPPFDFTLKLEVERGVDGTTAVEHTGTPAINALGDWNAYEITFHPIVKQITTAEIGVYLAGSTTLTPFTLNDNTAYLDINARNLILTDNKDDNSTIITNDVIIYDQNPDTNPPEYKLKVIQNFYEENESPKVVFEPEHSDINSNTEGFPESVSLARGPNAVYVGTGATAASKPQWIGKINHAQFGQQENNYIVENAELLAIDDGQTLFSLSYCDVPYIGTIADGTAVNRTSEKYLMALSNTKRKLYAVNNRVNSSSADDKKGKQAISEGIGFIPTGLGSSKGIWDHMSVSGQDKAPIVDGNFDSGTNTADSIVKHDEDVCYYLVGSYDHADRIYVFACRMNYDENSEPDGFAVWQFGYFNLKFEFVIDSPMSNFVALDSGDKIRRPPKSGAYINDIYEKNGYVYVQYGHNSGFTFDEEYLYVFPIADVLAGGSEGENASGLEATHVIARPITPPLLKLKNFGNDYMNKGEDWYASPEVCNFDGLSSQSWIGQDGVYGSYANYVKWRNIDVLGFTKNKKHALYSREVYTSIDGDTRAWRTMEPETGMWNKYFAEDIDFLSDNEKHEIPGYATGSQGDTRMDDNPKRSIEGGWDSGFMEPTFGFENATLRTLTGGITNTDISEDNAGEIYCAIYLVGKQIKSAIDMHKDRKSSQSWFTYKRRHYLRNVRAPEIEDIEEMVLMSTDRWSYGVAQRCVPFTMDSSNSDHRNLIARRHVETTTDEYDETTTTINADYIYGLSGYQQLNGAIDGDWSNALDNSVYDYSQEGATANNSVNYGSGDVIAPAKFTFRYGCYSNGRVSSGSYNSQRQLAAMNRQIIRLKTLDTESTDTNNNLVCRAPDDGQGLKPFIKNYKGKGWLLTTSRSNQMEKEHTYISKWEISHTDRSSSGQQTLNTVPTHNPLKIKTLGSSVIQGLATGGSEELGLWSTTGSPVQSGYAIYSHTSGQYTVNQTDPDASISNRFYDWPSGSLDFGLIPELTSQTEAIAGTDPVEYKAGAFMAGQTYYYKLSLLYDGYQESPLSSFEFKVENNTVYNYEQAIIDIEVSKPPKRCSHLILYRKNDPREFYRMVQEISFAKGWAYNATKDVYKNIIVDEGNTGATYEAITGIPESLTKTMIHYGLSVVAQGHLVVADCYHPEIKQGQNFIYKSEPNAFSNFNWAKNYCVLPTKPTAIAWFAGKIYAFDLNNTYRINLDNLVLEDTFEGVGCIGPDSLLVTDYGLFFADYQGLYFHNGQSPENIGMPIVKSSQAEDSTSLLETTLADDEKFHAHAWQDINHQIPPKIVYDIKSMSVLYCFQDKHNTGAVYNGAWKYNIARKRCDLIETPFALGTLSGNRNDSYICGDFLLNKVSESKIERELWSWKSKKMDLGASSVNKSYYSVNLICNNSAEAVLLKAALEDGSSDKNKLSVYINSQTPLDGVKYRIDKNKIRCQIKGASRVGTYIQFQLSNMEYEIDAISITYRLKKVR